MRRIFDSRILMLIGAATLCAQPIVQAQCSAGGSPAPPSAPSPPSPAPPAPPGPSSPASPGPSAPSGPGPSTPGPSAPSSPSGPAVGPSSPGPSAPSAPSGPARLAPTTDGPVTPKVADTSSASPNGLVDTTTWQFWWDNNKDAYLDLRRRVRRGGPRTQRTTDFIFIGDAGGAGGNGTTLNLMPNKAEIQRTIVPALYELIDSDDSTEIVRNALLSLAKIGVDQTGEETRRVQDTLVLHIADRNDRISEAAVVGLGLLGNWSATHALTDLLNDTAEGRRLISSNKVPTRLRAQAAYSMGLLAQRTTNADVRRFCVHKLTQEFPGERSALREVRIACVTSVGLVELESNGMSPKETEGRPAATSRETQIAWLLE